MPPKKKKVKVEVTEKGLTRTVEIEVEDTGPLKWGPLTAHRLLGKRVARVDGAAKVTGQAKYTADVRLPGMLYGKILRSPHAHARVRGIELSRVEKMPGVKATWSAGLREVRYAGEEIAAVAAVSEDIAEDAIHQIEVTYEILPFVVEEEEAMKPDAPKAVGTGSNIRPGESGEQGDLAQGFRQAAATVEATYRTQVQTHVCLEAHGTVARWAGDHLTVWTSTQGIFSVRDELAEHFQLPHNQVRVITEHMGGGFGSKFGAGIYSVICAELARRAEAPVKLILDRHEEHVASGNRPSIAVQVKAGATREGKLIAFASKAHGTGGVAGGAGIPLPYLYAVPHFRTDHADVFINAGGACAMRAPGHPQASFVMESVMDELAYQLGMDPLEFRMKNDPNPMRQKQYALGATRIGWSRRHPQPGAGPGPRKRGLGVASCVWGGGGGPGTEVLVRIHPDGSVDAATGTQDLGTGTRTLMAIIVAEEFGLEPQDIRVEIGDTRLLPSGASGGSTTAASVAPAVKKAASLAREKFLGVIAGRLKVPAPDLAIGRGKVYRKSKPAQSLSWKEAARRLGAQTIAAQGSWEASLAQGGVAGCQFVEVEVDCETGRVEVLRVVAVHDCGQVINRLAVESQINGGILQGIGFALYENRLLDSQTGRMVNANLEDYKIVGAMETPQVEAIVVDVPGAGVSGIGEPPVIPTAGAIANAIFHATGVRIRDLPITPDKILMALHTG